MYISEHSPSDRAGVALSGTGEVWAHSDLSKEVNHCAADVVARSLMLYCWENVLSNVYGRLDAAHVRASVSEANINSKSDNFEIRT